MDYAITKISSKGQIVIPVEMRKDLKEGDKLLIIQNKNQIIMKKATQLDRDLVDDLKFAKATEEAYKDIEAGNFISMEFDEFIEEMKKW